MKLEIGNLEANTIYHEFEKLLEKYGKKIYAYFKTSMI
jgi:hypothetical protein